MADEKPTTVIELLNNVLTGELTAINQYFLHAELFGHWGYAKLHTKTRADSIDEMKHAEQVIERILYLDGTPNVQRLGKINVGETVREAFTSDRDLEKEAIPRLNNGIELCTRQGDNGTRTILEQILMSEEAHLDWLETQLGLIERHGEEAYLAQQL